MESNFGRQRRRSRSFGLEKKKPNPWRSSQRSLGRDRVLTLMSGAARSRRTRRTKAAERALRRGVTRGTALRSSAIVPRSARQTGSAPLACAPSRASRRSFARLPSPRCASPPLPPLSLSHCVCAPHGPSRTERWLTPLLRFSLSVSSTAPHRTAGRPAHRHSFRPHGHPAYRSA